MSAANAAWLEQRERELNHWEADLVDRQNELDDAVRAFRDEMARSLQQLAQQRRGLDARLREVAERETANQRIEEQLADGLRRFRGMVEQQAEEGNSGDDGDGAATAAATVRPVAQRQGVPRLNLALGGMSAVIAGATATATSPARPESAAPFHGKRGRIPRPASQQAAHHADPNVVLAEEEFMTSSGEEEALMASDEVLRAANASSSSPLHAQLTDPRSRGAPISADQHQHQLSEGDGDAEEEEEEEGEEEQAEDEGESLTVHGNAVMTSSGRILTPDEAAEQLVAFGVLTWEEVLGLMDNGYSASALLAEHLLNLEEEDGRARATQRAVTPPRSARRPGQLQQGSRPPTQGHADRVGFAEATRMRDGRMPAVDPAGYDEVDYEEGGFDEGAYDEEDDFDDQEEEEEEEEEHSITLS
jgi:hypothetical protein